MLKRFILSLALFSGMAAMAQERIQGTIKPGSSPNSVMVAIRSNTTFSGNFSNVQFMLQIPNTATPQPVVQIKSNPLSANIPTPNYLTQVVDEGGFYNYLFAATVTGSPLFNFTSGVEVNALELEILNGPTATATVRLGHLPDGGSTFQLAFYVEMNGNDYTNNSAMFYASGSGSATNGGGYSTYSFTTLPNISLPAHFLAFTAYKASSNAVLDWSMENQDANMNYFEVERSFDGARFNSIGRVEINRTTPNAQYTYTDVNVFENYNGKAFYRIKLYERNGEALYSPIRTLRPDSKAFALNIYPNPVQKEANIAFTMDKAQPITIQLTDMRGKRIADFPMQTQKGLNQKKIDVSSLAAGTYMFLIRTEDESQTVPFVKSN
jgi:hypothetical protein